MNKAFIALLWIATALLTYWLGLEQGTDSAYSNAGHQSLPIVSSSIAKKEIKRSYYGKLLHVVKRIRSFLWK